MLVIDIQGVSPLMYRVEEGAISRHIVLMRTNVILSIESCPRAQLSDFFRATQNEM